MGALTDVVDQLLAASAVAVPTAATAPAVRRPPAAVPPVVGTVTQSTRLRCPRVVGRDPVLVSGRRAFAAVGGLPVAVVAGPGLGKSRLLAHLAREAEDAGHLVARGRGTASARGEVYRPVAELAAALVATPRAADAVSAALGPGAGPLRAHRAALAVLLPALVPSRDGAAGADPDPVAPFAVAQSLAALADLARGDDRPVVLVVDDLQWADAESLDVLDVLARRGAGDGRGGHRVLLGARPASSTDALLDALEGDEAAVVWRLGPLAPADAADLAEGVVGGRLPPALTEVVAARADGVPLVVEELANALVHSGALVPAAGGGFEFRHASAFEQVPESHAAAVRTRLAALGPDDLRLLRGAALLGREFSADRVAVVTRAGSATGPGMERLVASGLVERLAAGPVDHRFTHALSREAVLTQLGGRELAELAGEVLDSSGEEAGPERRADLALVAGRAAQAVDLLREAGALSSRRGGLATAERQLRRAVAVAAADVGDAEVELVEVLARAGRNDAAVTAGRDALRHVDGPRAARVHLALARVEEAGSQPEAATEHLDRARSAGADAVDLELVRSRVLLAERRLEDGEAAALEALRGHRNAEQACEALELVARCARTRDEAQAEAVLERMAALAEHHDLGGWQLRALSELGTIDLFRCRDSSRLRAARELAEGRGDLVTATVVGYHEAIRRFHAVELDGWEPWVTTLEDEASAYRLGDLVGALGVLRTCFLALEGRTAEAEARAAAATREDLDPDRRASLWGIVHAVLALAADDLPRARDAVARGVAAVADREFGDPSPMWGTHALLAVLDGADAEVVDDVRRRGTTVNRVNAGLATWADAVVAGRSGDPAAAAALAEEAVELLAPAPFYAGVAMRHVLAVATEQGWADGWAPAARSAADGLDAMGFAALARALAGGTGTAGSSADGLTARERDVLALVREGLTNAEIGGRLFISPRTVEKHVERLLAKTGATNRTRLATWRGGEPGAGS